MIEFRGVTHGSLQNFSAAAPHGVVIGLIGEKGSGKANVLRLAGTTERPSAGEVEAPGERRYIAPHEPLNLSPVAVLALDQALALQDAVVRARAAVSLDRLRAAGSTILLSSHEPLLLRSLCDEVWWLENGSLAGKGHPDEILRAYQERVAAKVRAWGEGLKRSLAPALRRGDGRAEIISLQTLGENGHPTLVLRSGELATVRLEVRFLDPVLDPVIGIMIRTRIGLEVYGTNTELEHAKVGPCAAGETKIIRFGFRCELCPGEYTLTAASHDPDGLPHDWMEDAVAFSVTDSRYTAGVANLHASVQIASGPAR